MVKNSFGFTMIELLAAIVVLGILMGVGVPVVMNIMTDQKHSLYINDAIRLASLADSKIRSDNKIQIPPRAAGGDTGGCIVIGLDYMDNNGFEAAPYGGVYDKTRSFVVAQRNESTASEEYTYYVRLVEELSNGAYRGVNFIEVDKLYEDNAIDKYVENVGTSAAFQLNGFSDASGSYNELMARLSSLKPDPDTDICGLGISGVYFRE